MSELPVLLQHEPLVEAPSTPEVSDGAMWHETLSNLDLLVLIAVAHNNNPWAIRNFSTFTYSLPLNVPTFSSLEGNSVLSEIFNDQKFQQKIASIYADLAEKQEPLEREFAAVWDANVELLYES